MAVKASVGYVGLGRIGWALAARPLGSFSETNVLRAAIRESPVDSTAAFGGPGWS